MPDLITRLSSSRHYHGYITQSYFKVAGYTLVAYSAGLFCAWMGLNLQGEALRRWSTFKPGGGADLPPAPAPYSAAYDLALIFGGNEQRKLHHTARCHYCIAKPARFNPHSVPEPHLLATRHIPHATHIQWTTETHCHDNEGWALVGAILYYLCCFPFCTMRSYT